MPAAVQKAGATGRYDLVAITLHWVIAAGILALIAMGLVMDHMTLPPMRVFQFYQLHKSIGITVMLAVVLRVLWRLFHAAPALPAAMTVQERRAAHGVHGLLYGLQVFLPLSGWALVSASVFNIPTVLYGILPWPHLPFFSTLHDKAPVEAVLKTLHHWGAWMLTAIIALHVAAALRHHFILKDGVLRQMLPGRRPIA
ncbi:cytochrome B561 [Gluconacetobacter johannae DSM 13595]|uniref:Cytochrome b n=1 Tax=Gluconacetobacter johannae TaxID=112140 RepID=A0A7W4P2P1_9PROT|nr:cytochrome b [Gluconacetobacter johannae]MBB2174989.1 cytochrome b [Gluconacetobacter johannae]GBQ88072.1 cytochrome B561 [Gluconacetobacter johannae DSM 13595]